MVPASPKGDDQSTQPAQSRSESSETGDCTSRLAAADAALVVTLRSSPRSWLAAHDCARDVAFISTYPHPNCHRTFPDPADTVGIALAVADWLDGLPDAVDPLVCIVTLDTVVANAGRVAVRRFLQVVTSRVRAAGGTIHYHGDADGDAAMSAARCPTASHAEDRRSYLVWGGRAGNGEVPGSR